MSKTTELLQNHFEELQKKYEEILPKVDPKLIMDYFYARWRTLEVIQCTW
jgi:hypothetical protein